MKMLENGGGKCFPVGWGAAAKPCDSCKTAGALLFCRTDSAFLCMTCDEKLHSGMRHARVWMCEVCEQAPASVTCKADAAELCVTCDRDIHSANPLARRHERIPVVPLYDCAEAIVKSNAATFLVRAGDELNGSALITTEELDISTCIAQGEPHPNISDWMFPTTNPPKLAGDSSPESLKPIELLFSVPDQLLDFDYPIPTDSRLQSHFNNSGNDSVVPVQVEPMKRLPPAKIINQLPENRFEIDFTKSHVNSYSSSYNNQSISHSVSSSSMDVGIVPDGSSTSDISCPFVLQMNSGMDSSGSRNGNQASQLSGMDREARVLRYREKRKNRKFEKTIRYASRKAYAETRPRIKGRFAKRTETEADVDRWFTLPGSNTFIAGDAQYGVVPSY